MLGKHVSRLQLSGLSKLHYFFLGIYKENDSLPSSFPFCAVPGFIVDSAAFQPALTELVNKINSKYCKMIEKLDPNSQVEVWKYTIFTNKLACS